MKSIETKVVGVTFKERQGFLAYLNKQTDVMTYLRREPKNEYDANAVAIIAYVPSSKKHIKIGYINKDLAKEIAPLLDKGQAIYARELEILGGHGMTYGAKLKLINL